ncbi:MAG TPA: TlpA disulfide reductase family protein [Gemmatimonadaceae bacterium]|nr:TlpA disulfide reductase family protein [Gemmatimonadaceae bacterium]
MTRREQWGWIVAIVLVLIAGIVATTHALRDELRPVTLGSKAPPFEAMTLDAHPERRTLEDYRGKVVLLNIWATWCGPCIVEMPTIEALHREFKGTDFRIVAVSVDAPNTEKTIRAFVKELGLTFEVLYDPEGDIALAYQATGYPQTFVIGRDGVIRKKVMGAVNWHSDGNRALVRQLLAERGA